MEENSTLQDLTNDISQWATQNKMVINGDKCQVMHFYTAKKPLVLPDIVIGGKSILISTASKLLGVKISNSITWQEHVNDLVTRGSRALYSVYALRDETV